MLYRIKITNKIIYKKKNLLWTLIKCKFRPWWTSRNEKNQNAFRISSNAKSNEFQSKDKSRRISLHLVQEKRERRHDLIFESEASHSFVPFRSEGNERKTNSLRPDRYTYIPLPSSLREERLSQHANRCAMSGRILDAEQNWYNTLVILILSAHISQTRISWLHNGCRTDGVTGVYTTLQIVPRFKSLEIYTNVYICVCVSKLISQNRGFAIIFA